MGCSDKTGMQEQPSIQRLIVTGSSTAAPLVSDIAKRFEQSQPDIRIDIQTGGSSRGITDAGNGLADIGLSSRALTLNEKEILQCHTLAQDGVCFLIHKNNPIQKITNKQLKNIYTGKTTNWKQLGGLDKEITVIQRAQGRSEVSLVCQYFDVKPSDIKADLIAGENQQGIKMVANDESAIVYMSVGTSEYEVSRGTPIKLLPLKSIPATAENVAKGDYPLSRPLIFVTQSHPSQLVSKFIEFAQSPQVNDLIKDHSFVSITTR